MRDTKSVGLHSIGDREQWAFPPPSKIPEKYFSCKKGVAPKVVELLHLCWDFREVP